MHDIIKKVKANRLTYLEEEALEDLIYEVERCNQLSGCYIEAGCALGGSAICMASVMGCGKKLKVYDVFGMIPAPTERDGQDVKKRYDEIRGGVSEGIDGDIYYGYQNNLDLIVENNFKQLLCIEDLLKHNIELIKGLFEETIHLDEKVALAHIDCDWYDSVYVCLDRIVPRLVSGGVIIIDDYYAWSGCKKAVDDYMIDKKDEFYFIYTSRLHIIKKGMMQDTMLLEEMVRTNQKLFEKNDKILKEFGELKKWCDELQRGKEWIEAEYVRLKDWCNELQQGNEWLEKQT